MNQYPHQIIPKTKRKVGNFKKVYLLEKIIEFEIPTDWNLEKKKSKLFVLTFPYGKYPLLDINVEVFDDPKIKSEDDIFKFLTEAIEDIKKPTKLYDNTYMLNYKVESQDDNLFLWKIFNFNKPRGFRLLRLSLGWAKTEEADKIIKIIVNDLNKVINSIKFFQGRHKYDDLASLDFKIKTIKLIKLDFWNIFKISLPQRWNYKIDEKSGEVFVSIENSSDYQFFFEKLHMDVEKLQKKVEENEKVILKLIENMTKDIFIEEQSLKKTDNNNYLFSFTVKEKTKENAKSTIILLNKIWYRIKIHKNKILIISFIFNYKEEFLEKGLIYSNKIDNLISNSEII